MQFFEFHFNKQDKGQNLFESFVFDPENENQEVMGNLIVAGEINNATQESEGLLNDLAKLIKENHYSACDIASKISFKKSLVKANSYLKNLAKDGKVNWLGNFNFFAMNASQDLINFVKVGNIKILLIREKEIYDIGENLEYQSNDGVGSYFLNVAIGKLGPDDRLIVATSKIYDLLNEKNILKKIVALSDWSQKNLSQIFKQNKKEIANVQGMILMTTSKEKEAKKPIFNFALPKITIPKITTPFMEMPNFNFSGKSIAIFSVITLVLTGAGFAIFKFGFSGQNQTASVQTVQTESNQEGEPIGQTDATVLPEPKIPAFFNMGDLNFSPAKISIVSDAIYLFNASNEFYKLNTKDLKAVKNSSQYPLEILTPAESSIFFFSPTSTIAEYDTLKDVLGYQQIKLEETVKINDIFYYNNKLYFLDSQSGVIYKKSKDKIEEALKVD